MSYCLPADLYYLPRDNLDPEKFELIMSPSHAWSRIDSEYVFDDNWSSGFQLVNMQRRAFNGYTNQLPPHGPREREKLKSMVYGGQVVMLERFSTSAGKLFYINDDGELICRDPLAFRFSGAQRVIDAYKNTVARCDYSRTGGKPRPTPLPVQSTAQQPASRLSTAKWRAACWPLVVSITAMLKASGRRQSSSVAMRQRATIRS